MAKLVCYIKPHELEEVKAKAAEFEITISSLVRLVLSNQLPVKVGKSCQHIKHLF